MSFISTEAVTSLHVVKQIVHFAYVKYQFGMSMKNLADSTLRNLCG